MKYRSRTEITSQILDVAVEGVTKTKIMYKAFLSYAQLKEYLDVLLTNGLLDYNKKDEIFKTTEKGLRFLKIYVQLSELAPRSLDTQKLDSLT
jgi:predicted transcriptional regulator